MLSNLCLYCRHAHFYKDTKTRQYEMLRDYGFKCFCEACTNDYKMFNATPPLLLRDPQFDQKFPKPEAERLIVSRDLDFIWNFYDRACKYMEQYGTENYSVTEILIMHLSMLRILTVAMDFQADLNWKQ